MNSKYFMDYTLEMYSDVLKKERSIPGLKVVLSEEYNLYIIPSFKECIGVISTDICKTDIFFILSKENTLCGACSINEGIVAFDRDQCLNDLKKIYGDISYRTDISHEYIIADINIIFEKLGILDKNYTLDKDDVEIISSILASGYSNKELSRKKDGSEVLPNLPVIRNTFKDRLRDRVLI